MLQLQHAAVSGACTQHKAIAHVRACNHTQGSQQAITPLSPWEGAAGHFVGSMVWTMSRQLWRGLDVLACLGFKSVYPHRNLRHRPKLQLSADAVMQSTSNSSSTLLLAQPGMCTVHTLLVVRLWQCCSAAYPASATNITVSAQLTPAACPAVCTLSLQVDGSV